MAQFEYMVVPAPNRARRMKGVSAAEDRFAATLAETLNAHADDGWEFLRAETLPVEERTGLARSKTIFRSTLIFRRLIDTGDEEPTRTALHLLNQR